jgi:hypothetical protein
MRAKAFASPADSLGSVELSRLCVAHLLKSRRFAALCVAARRSSDGIAID